MTTDIPQVPKNSYEQLKCTSCQKIIGWGICTCQNGEKGLLECICAECYLQKMVNKQPPTS